MSLPPFQYLAPKTGEELAGMLAAHRSRARILAGGTDLINWMAERMVTPEYVIDLKNMRYLTAISNEPGKGLTIGAATKIRAIEKSAVIKEKYPSLAMAAGQIGSPQVRAMASIGGNLCNASPCADMPPPLISFDATVTVAGVRGRRSMPLEDFIQGNRQTAIEPDEFLEYIQVPEPRTDSASLYEPLGLRAAQEIDIASVAVYLALERKTGTVAHVRIVMGAVAPMPMRARKAEEILAGREPTEENLDRAVATCSQECRPIDDLRASASYRRYVIQVLSRRLLSSTLAAIG